MKECTKCNVSKNESEFHLSKITSDKLHAHCKECKRNYDIEYRKSEKVQKYQQSDIYKDKKKDYINANYLERKISNIRSRIKSSGRNLEFSITSDDLEIPEYCPLLNVKLNYKIGTGRNNGYTASIDRIDNNKGYIKGNVWVISKLANTMKNRASIDELLTFSKNTIKIFKK